MTPAGGEDTPARGGPHDPPRAGHIICCICTGPIPLSEYCTARCWMDPQGKTCAAHVRCLLALGEREIGLR
jgi:hypothetical protein